MYYFLVRHVVLRRLLQGGTSKTALILKPFEFTQVSGVFRVLYQAKSINCKTKFCGFFLALTVPGNFFKPNFAECDKYLKYSKRNTFSWWFSVRSPMMEINFNACYIL